MNVPSGWRSLTPHQLVGEDKSRLVIGPFGSSLKTSDYRPAGVPLVFVRDIRNGDFQAPRAFVSEEKAAQLRSHVALPGDVLITKMGEPPGDVAVYSGSGPAVITADCIRLRPTEDFDARFIGYAIQAPAIRRQIEFITNGVAQRKVSLSRFRTGLCIPVPRLDEQRRIVDLLEDHLSRLDAGEVALARAVRRAEMFVAAARDEVWTQYEGRTRVADIGAVVTGKTPPTKGGNVFGDDVPFVTPGDIGLGLRVESVQRGLTASGAAGSRLAPPGSLLAVCIGATLGKIGWSSQRVAFNQQINAVLTPSLQHSQALAGLMASPTFQRQMWMAASATTMPILNKSKFSQLDVPVLPDGDIASVAERLSGIADDAGRLTDASARASRQSATLRRSLLAAAFSGRLTGSDTALSVAEEIIGA